MNLIEQCCLTFVDAYIGISIGTDISSSESASDIISILQSNNIKHVRLFDSGHQMLEALANTGIEVMVSIPNNQLQAIGESQEKAAEWIDNNIKPFIPSTYITCIAVGDEAPSTLPAMKHLHSALLAADLDYEIKISSPQSLEMIQEPFPPSAASFNATSIPDMHNLLQFLKNTGSPFMLNAHPSIYDLFQPVHSNKPIMDPNTLLYYSNMFDAVVDAAYYSMEALNFSGIPVILTEPMQQEAITNTALVHGRSLIWDSISRSGTPSRPHEPVSIYIHLFDEGLQHGLVSGRMMYSVTLAAGGLFCVANQNADPNALQVGLNWACGPGGADCSAIQPGQPCYDSNNLAAVASYAYNDYYQRTQATGGTCSFNNTAMTTTNDPSKFTILIVT